MIILRIASQPINGYIRNILRCIHTSWLIASLSYAKQFEVEEQIAEDILSDYCDVGDVSVVARREYSFLMVAIAVNSLILSTFMF